MLLTHYSYDTYDSFSLDNLLLAYYLLLKFPFHILLIVLCLHQQLVQTQIQVFEYLLTPFSFHSYHISSLHLQNYETLRLFLRRKKVALLLPVSSMNLFTCWLTLVSLRHSLSICKSLSGLIIGIRSAFHPSLL